MEGGRIIVVINTCIHTARYSTHKIEPACCMQSKERAGVIERNAKVEDIGVRVKNVGPRINRFRTFKRDPLADFEVETALSKNGKVQTEIRLRNIGLI